MEKKSWTEQQSAAFGARDGSVLVSAAAGSGKTAVLVERVIARLSDPDHPCPVDELLVVTFTQAAAAEMKERIAARFDELLRDRPNDSYLLKQRLLLPAAEVCTIDRFCSVLVKRNYGRLGITPDFRIMDDNEKKIVAKEAADEVMETLYAENSNEFKTLAELFIHARTDVRLPDVILRLYDNAQAHAFPEAWLRSAAALYDPDTAPQDSPWGKRILEELDGMLGFVMQTLTDCIGALRDEPPLAEKYMPAFKADLHFCMDALSAVRAGDWDGAKAFLESYRTAKVNLRSAPKEYLGTFLQTHVKQVRDRLIKKLLEKAAGLMTATEKEYREDTAALKPVIEKLFGAVQRFSEVFAEKKAKRNAYDFADVEHKALSLLVSGVDEKGGCVRTELALELSQKYREILIDEYQDTNRAQDLLFSALSRDEDDLFLVGDVKQSIYAFRQAMPEIFTERLSRLPDYSPGVYPAKINLDVNFRSRRVLADAVNYIFGRVMSARMGGVDYKGAELLTAQDDYPPADFPCVELHIVDKSKARGEDKRPEARHVAETVERILESRMPVRTREGTRPVACRDICILLRATTDAESYFSALAERGIPAFFQKKSGFFERREVGTMLSFLEILDNPLQDVPLISVLLSPIFGFIPDDLARLRIGRRNGCLFHALSQSMDAKCAAFMEEYREYRRLSTALSAAELIRVIYDRTAFPSVVTAMEDGETRRLNLLLLLRYAQEYETNVQPGLSGFIRYLHRTRENKNDLGAAAGVSRSADVVRIMSIHLSKGLEFPIVILADCGRGFNAKSQKEKLLIDPTTKLGVGLERLTRDGRLFETVQRTACRLSIQGSERAEELRILYVALTRARERLILSGAASNAEKLAAECSLALGDGPALSPVLVGRAGSCLELLTTVFLRHPDAGILRSLAGLPESMAETAAFPLSVACVGSAADRQEAQEQAAGAAADQGLLREIAARCSYQYPYAKLAGYEAKAAASSLFSAELSEQYAMTAAPAFLREAGPTPALRGTATHRFLELCDLKACEDGFEDELQRLAESGKLSAQEAAALDREALSRFFSGELSRRMRASENLFREQKFTILIPLRQLDPSLPETFGNENTVVQGIIDCAFVEDGKIVLVDYKTDAVRDEASFRRRYRGQLSIYRRAAREIWELPVKETLIYSLKLNKAIKLDFPGKL